MFKLLYVCRTKNRFAQNLSIATKYVFYECVLEYIMYQFVILLSFNSKKLKKKCSRERKKFTFSMIRNRSFWICLLPHLITFSSWLLHFITSKGWRGATQSYTFSDANDSVCPGRLRKRSFYIHGILLRFELMLHRK